MEEGCFLAHLRLCLWHTFSSLSYTAQGYLPRDGDARSRLCPSASINKEDNPSETNLTQAISQLRFSSQSTLGCI